MPFIALYTISWFLHTSYPFFCKCPMGLRRSGVDILLRTERWTITCSHHSGHSWASSFTIAHNQDWEQSAVHSHQSQLSRVESTSTTADSWEHFAEWKKPDTREHTTYDSIFMNLLSKKVSSWKRNLGSAASAGNKSGGNMVTGWQKCPVDGAVPWVDEICMNLLNGLL